MKNNINKIIEDYAAYYYNNYPPKQINKKRPYSFSASKIKNNKNETSIYQKIEEERIVKKLYPPTKEKQKEKEKEKEKSKKKPIIDWVKRTKKIQKQVEANMIGKRRLREKVIITQRNKEKSLRILLEIKIKKG